jgi:hypothetical protein
VGAMSMFRLRQAFFAVVFVLEFLAVFSCSSPQVNLGTGPRSFLPSDYQQVFDLWTRNVQVLPVDGIDNVLTAQATFLSYEFRWAYVVRVSNDLRLTPSERQTLQDREFSALDDAHEFFVSMMSGVKEAADLDPKDGPWHIRLEDDRGRSTSPLEVKIIKDPTAEEIKYFDFDKLHRKAYRVRFPKLADDGRAIITSATQFFTLSFSSPYGQAFLRWDVAAN